MPDYWGTTPAELEAHRKRLKLAEKILLPKIKQGEQWAIRSALGLVSRAIKDGAALPRDLAAFVSESIGGIASGATLHTPFGLKRRRGERELAAKRAEAFRRSYRVVYQVKVKRKTIEQAIAEIAGADGVPEDTVRDQWKKHRRNAIAELELERKYLGDVIAI